MARGFQPLGDKARWRLLYDEMVKIAPGGLLTYGDACRALGLSDTEDGRRKVQMAMQRCAEELLEKDNRAVINERGSGYRIAHANQHVELAQKHQRKARGELEVGHRHTTNVDYNQLSPEARKVLDVVGQAMSLQVDFMRRMDVRQGELEKVVETVSKQAERTDEEVQKIRQEMEERIAALEARHKEDESEDPS